MTMIPLRRSWGLAAIALLALSNGASATPPTGPRCERELAEDAFTSAITAYIEEDYKNAIPDLEKAAKFCRASDDPWWAEPVGPLYPYPYAPFFYLGSCHKELANLPDALRNFYLSSCVGEPARYPKKAQELGSLTQQCRVQLSSKRRPSEHPHYQEWSTASKSKKPKWDEAAKRMWDAVQVWEDDGKTMFLYGRVPAPYVPRFRLADALFQLGCYQQACEQLGLSKLEQVKQTDPKGKRPELERLEQLELQCQKKPRDQNIGICQEWRCWLRQGSP